MERDIKSIINKIKKLQKSINEQEIRLNNKLQEPRNLKERVARLFSCPEKEAEKILETMEKKCEKLKNRKKKLINKINKARESIRQNPSECLQKLGEKDYGLTDSLKDSCNDLGQNFKRFCSKLNPFKK